MLVVDDEQYVRETVRRTLELAGYIVVCAAGSAEAMQLFQSLGPQIELAIVDLTMPGEGGGEVVRRLRHHDPNLKVIASSGYAEAEVKAEFGDMMNAFLPKPYRSDQLRDMRCHRARECGVESGCRIPGRMLANSRNRWCSCGGTKKLSLPA